MHRSLCFRTLCLLLVCSALACASPLSTAAGEASSSVTMLPCEFWESATDVRISWNFAYSDDMFAQTAEVYHHDLARLSLGLALSSFRMSKNVREVQDLNVINYLEHAGFVDLESTDYDQEPSVQTVSSVLGHKRMRDDQGEYTLLVAGICGGNYELEWLSNFTIGSKTRHEGFNRAAQVVEGRILVYLADHELQGRLKLWVSGYSRAAAVSNIVAADMTDFGPFGRENVFAYTFATPRTTLDPKEGSYPNIFNIVGKFDVVPQLPLADWGFRRYGTDLQTPSQETDSDYGARFQRMKASYREITGNDFWSNPEVNHRLMSLFSYLLELLPTPEVYVQHMQDRLKDLMAHKSLLRAVGMLASIASDRALINDDNRDEANELLNFAVSLGWDIFQRDGGISRQWSNDYNVVGNLMREHLPYLYLGWMYSSENPEEIFTDSESYQRYIVQGDATITLLDEQERSVACIDAQGNVKRLDAGTEYEAETQDMMIYMTQRDNQSIIDLPNDKPLWLFTSDVQSEKLLVACVNYNIHTIRANTKGQFRLGKTLADSFPLNILDPNKPITDVLNSILEGVSASIQDNPEFDEEAIQAELDAVVPGDYEFELVTEDLGLSTSAINRLESANVFHLSWVTLLNIAIAVPVILLILLLVLLVYLIRRRPSRRRHRDHNNRDYRKELL